MYGGHTATLWSQTTAPRIHNTHTHTHSIWIRDGFLCCTRQTRPEAAKDDVGQLKVPIDLRFRWAVTGDLWTKVDKLSYYLDLLCVDVDHRLRWRQVVGQALDLCFRPADGETQQNLPWPRSWIENIAGSSMDWMMEHIKGALAAGASG